MIGAEIQQVVFDVMEVSGALVKVLNDVPARVRRKYKDIGCTHGTTLMGSNVAVNGVVAAAAGDSVAAADRAILVENEVAIDEVVAEIARDRIIAANDTCAAGLVRIADEFRAVNPV